MYDVTQPVVTLLGIPLQFSGAAVLTAESELTSAAALIASGSASLSADTTLVSAANVTATAAAALSAESDLAAAGYLVFVASASMSAQADLTVTVKVINAAATIVVGTSNLVATSTSIQYANAVLQSNCNLTAELYISAPVAARPLVASSELSATVRIPLKLLVLPTVEYSYTTNVLLERFPIANGQSLLITGATGVLGDFFAQEQAADADYYFGGGRRHVLNDVELSAVETAGFGEYVVTE